MKVRLSIAAAVTATVLFTASAVSSERPKGYLAPDEFDVTHVIEPAPRPGDPRYETDRKIFKATRKLVDTPRWKLATEDADYTVPALARDFSCAVGVKLTPQNAPKLMMLIERAGADTGVQSSKAKAVYQRHRPFTIDKGRICQPESELYDEKKQRMSYDYPSGHTTWGWTWALVLSSIAPDRAQQILERGRAYGDSRFVCGAHNESAVEAGMLSATATMAVVQTKPEYQADREAAKAELDALRHSGEQPTACEAEASLLNQRVMPRF
ncbi:acid phosphatase (class A) [Novosphingobium sp. PhB57]|uniref:acid phosphatase n=1 Tax=Novosphingobium sp. PhB57 TaxID=2485107 RepID=UPI001048EB7B|nr:phosphatase PAP2 family protein [Novosphingobium sp. PhB57]TCU54578.1 acid phosphatase (class A) [Novosphingobium sp. PhB57]